MAIDLSRSAITVALGIRDVDPNATVFAGMILSLNSSGQVTPADGAIPYGVAKWNKATINYGVVIDEPVVMTSTDTKTLKHANLRADSYVVHDISGTPYTVNTDYTINTTNGTITRIETGGTIVSGSTVYVNYSYELTEFELHTMQGTNYMNLVDDTQGSGKMTVIQDFAELYTDQYDTSELYTPGDELYVGQTTEKGLFTKKSTSTKKYGKVIKAPSAADPYLGVQIGAGV